MEAVRDPYLGLIYQDRDFPERNIYYRRNTAGPRYIKVVVEFSELGYGEVITAFMTDSGKSGELLL